MRILHVTDTFAPTVGGIEMLVAGLAEAQARAGHDVSVLTRTPGPDPSPWSPFLLSRSPNRLAELTNGVDVVHAHVSAYSPFAVEAAVGAAQRGVPALATVHSVWGRAWPLIAGWARSQGYAALPIRWAGVSGVAAEFVERAVRPPDPVLVVPNAIDTTAWAPRVDRRPNGSIRIDGTLEPITIVSTMRMVSRKRPLPLLAALREVRGRTPSEIPLRAVLVGGGPQLARLHRYVRRHRMAWVELPGPLTQQRIREVYDSAHVYVAPAILESFGLAALEARTAGLPVVARRHTGIADFVEHGVNGLLADDDHGLADAVAILAASPALRARLARHNREVVPEHSWAEALQRADLAYKLAAQPGG